MKVYIETYGCWLNKADTEVIKTILSKLGAIFVDDWRKADVIIVNTCAVREDTERKILKRLKELSERAPKAKIIIAGCLAKARPATISEICPSASLVEPNAVEKIDEVIESTSRELLLRGFIRDFSVLPEPRGITYFIPIEVGCVGSCAYCIMPYTRGKVTSCPPERVVEAIKKAVKKGCKDIHLTAQDAAAYGLDIGHSLPKLIKNILNNVKGDYWLKISMMEPSTTMKIINELIDVMKDNRVYKYIHIPVQSGDDNVLKLMRRKYTVKQYCSLISRFLNSFEKITFATDIIVGFPGEDEKAFENTCCLLNKLKPDKVHVARYTIRPFTLAQAMKQVHEPIKKARSRKLVRLVNRITLERNLSYLGEEVHVLVTKALKKGYFSGRTITFKPVVFKGDQRVKIGDKVLVKVKYVNPFYLVGELRQ